MTEDLFDSAGNLKDYLLLLDVEANVIEKEGTTRGDNKQSRTVALLSRLFLKKLGRENYEKWLKNKLTVAEALKITAIFVRRKTIAQMLNKAYNYKITNTAGLGTLIREDPYLKDYIAEVTGSKPHIVYITTNGAKLILTEAKPKYEAQQDANKKSDESPEKPKKPTK